MKLMLSCWVMKLLLFNWWSSCYPVEWWSSCCLTDEAPVILLSDDDDEEEEERVKMFLCCRCRHFLVLLLSYPAFLILLAPPICLLQKGNKNESSFATYFLTFNCIASEWQACSWVKLQKTLGWALLWNKSILMSHCWYHTIIKRKHTQK